MTTDLVRGDDGRLRCPWGGVAGMMQRYHDEEWGVVVRDDRALFERLTLEAFQSGLSWAIVLRKRPRFREVFADFAWTRVAAFSADDVTRLLDDTGIIRNRAKIEATVANARAIEALDGSLSDLLWSFAPDRAARPAQVGDVPSRTPESTALARDLKRRGFSFVGPTTAYALMQATGMVDDHLQGCWVRSGGS